MMYRLATPASFAAKTSLLALTACLALSGSAFGQRAAGGGGGGGRSRGGALQTPFPFLSKLIKFPVSRLSRTNFVEMGAVRSMLPKGFSSGIKQEQQVVLLSYGFKKGGIVRIFETTAVPGTKPEELAKLINESGTFHNVARGDFKFKSVPTKGVFVVASSDNEEALKSALQELSGK